MEHFTAAVLVAVNRCLSALIVVVVVLPDPFRGAPTPRKGSGSTSTGDPTVGPRPKVWTRGQKWKNWCQRWRAGEARMRDS